MLKSLDSISHDEDKINVEEEGRFNDKVDETNQEPAEHLPSIKRL